MKHLLYSLPIPVKRLRRIRRIELRGPKTPGFHSCFAYSQRNTGKIVLFAIPKTRHFTQRRHSTPTALLHWQQFFKCGGWVLRDREGWHFGWRSDKDVKRFFRYVFCHELGHLLQSKRPTDEQSAEIFASIMKSR